MTRTPVTYALILINVVVFLWEMVTGALAPATTYDPIVSHGAIYGPAVFGGHEYWRLISGAFLHGGVLHIALNMFALWQVGRFVELITGSARMLVIYFICAILSSYAAAYFNYDQAVVGASGAIFGLFGALVAIGIRLGKRGRDLITQTLPIIVLNLVLGFSIANIANSAHIGGLIAGFLSGLLIYQPPAPVRAQVVDAATGQELESSIETP